MQMLKPVINNEPNAVRHEMYSKQLMKHEKWGRERSKLSSHPRRISRKGLEGEMLGEGDGGVEKGWGDGSMGSVSPRC
jgi:hypothetical protein